MKIFIAETINNANIIEIISGKFTALESPVSSFLINQVKSIDIADAILVPHDAYDFVKNDSYLRYLIEISKLKQIIISDRSDFPIKPKIKNSISLRVAINPGESNKNCIVVPYNVLNLSELEPRKYNRYPETSFMGYVPNILSPRRFMKSIKQSPKHPLIGNGAIVRRLAISNCTKNLPNFSFTKRETYFTGVKNRELRIPARIEYLDSIKESDFILTPRGDANQSIRFYEALSAGRLTLIPNSQISFPTQLVNSEILKISSLFFNLRERNLNLKVNEFWKSNITSINYSQIQKRIRNFYSEELDFNVFIRKIFQYDLNTFMKIANFRT
jgi:hypothetical protein